jgi:hypothetical protein
MYSCTIIIRYICAASPKADPNVVDLHNYYIKEYLIDLKRRSPQTVDLYRRHFLVLSSTTRKIEKAT